VTRIYTRTGDAGDTALFGGRRVRKDDPRVSAYGAVDELNAVLGVARAAQPPDSIDAVLARLQHFLFDLGSELAAPPDAAATAGAHASRVLPAWIEELEHEIDRVEDTLPPLRAFILPGGTPAAAALHQARAAARRAERDIVRLAAAEPVNPELLKFVNRLSDLLFVLARAANHAAGVPDVEWRQTREGR
jgi:cob(I)alamin adenosyltransferase